MLGRMIVGRLRRWRLRVIRLRLCLGCRRMFLGLGRVLMNVCVLRFGLRVRVIRLGGRC